MIALAPTFAASRTFDDRVNDPNLWFPNYGGGSRTVAGVDISPQGSLAISTYYACLRVIAEDTAKLPFKTYKAISPRGKEPLPSHPAWRILKAEPNPEMAAMSMRETMTHHAAGWGGGFAEIERTNAGKPLNMWPIHPSRVVVTRDNKGRLVYDVHMENGTTVRIQSRNMFHLHGLGPDGITGYSLARLAAEALGLSLAMQTFGAAFFGNGTHPAGILTTPQRLKGDAAKRLREDWSKAYGGGPANAKHPAVLEQDLKWSPLTVPPEEAQFLEGRGFQVVEVCRFCRVAPHKAQHLDRATFSNIQHQALEHVGDTLMPWLTRWEQEADRKLIDEPDVFTKHVIRGLLRGDLAAQVDYYTKRFMNGSMSQNDIREAEDENPVPNGDVYYVPVQLVDSNAPDETEPEPEADPPDEPDATATATRATMAVFHDAATRVLTKEGKAVDRAANKHADDPDGLMLWADDFYAKQETYMRNVFEPAAIVLAELLGADPALATDAIHDQSISYVFDARAFVRTSTVPNLGNYAIGLQIAVGAVAVQFSDCVAAACGGEKNDANSN